MEAVSDWDDFFWLVGRVDGGGYPAEVDQDEVVSFEEPVGNPEMLKIIKRGRALAPWALKKYGPKAGSLPTNRTDWDGVQHDATREGAADALRKRLHPMAVPTQRVLKKAAGPEKDGHHIIGVAGVDSDSHVWVITGSSDAVFAFGKVMKPAKGSIITGPEVSTSTTPTHGSAWSSSRRSA